MLRKLILKLAKKYVLVVSKDIQPGDLIEYVDDSDFVAEAIGIYYSYDLKPFLFFRTQDGYITSRPLHEFKRCTDWEKIHAGNY